jgi:sensor c-di-GMP phosphodiesterase-like protein
MQDNKNDDNEQTIKEQIKIIQEDNYAMFYKPGNFVDVRFYDNWEVGKIDKEDKGTVLVYSFVEQSKRSQFYKSDPHKISRFRKNTKAMNNFCFGNLFTLNNNAKNALEFYFIYFRLLMSNKQYPV